MPGPGSETHLHASRRLTLPPSSCEAGASPDDKSGLRRGHACLEIPSSGYSGYPRMDTSVGTITAPSIACAAVQSFALLRTYPTTWMMRLSNPSMRLDYRSHRLSGCVTSTVPSGQHSAQLRATCAFGSRGIPGESGHEGDRARRDCPWDRTTNRTPAQSGFMCARTPSRVTASTHSQFNHVLPVPALPVTERISDF